jgi:hypothetical protein
VAAQRRVRGKGLLRSLDRGSRSGEIAKLNPRDASQAGARPGSAGSAWIIFAT